MQPETIDLVVTDLDGTLWAYGSEGVPHERTLEAWAELDRRGIPVLVATGRRVTTAVNRSRTTAACPSAVVLNGALGSTSPPVGASTGTTTTLTPPSVCSRRSALVGSSRACTWSTTSSTYTSARSRRPVSST